MKNIDRWIYSTMTDDSTLMAYIGGTSSDPRVYYAYPPKSITLSDTNAYLIYFFVASGEIPADAAFRVERPAELYQISIFTKDKNLMNTIHERVDVLFNRIHDATISGWKVRHIHRVSAREAYLGEDHIYQKMLDYRFDGVWISE